MKYVLVTLLILVICPLVFALQDAVYKSLAVEDNTDPKGPCCTWYWDYDDSGVYKSLALRKIFVKGQV